MTDLEDKYIKELEDICNEFKILENNSLLGDISDSDTEDLTQVITRAKAAVGRIALRNSDYYADVEKIVQSEKDDSNKLRKIIGVVRGLLQDIKSGYLKSLTEIIHSDVFSDFLEMAEYLSNEGYKRASAVIAGSTLEEHLRKLCIKNGISIEATGSRGNVIPKKADLMNSELSKNSIYTVTEQKQITAWLAIRNDAAHAKDENHSYSKSQTSKDYYISPSWNDEQVRQFRRNIREQNIMIRFNFESKEQMKEWITAKKKTGKLVNRKVNPEQSILNEVLTRWQG